MLSKTASLLRGLRPQAARSFAASDAMALHKKEHFGDPMDERIYENIFWPTSIGELDFVRPPFVELSRMYHCEEGDELRDLMKRLSQKNAMLDIFEQVNTAPHKLDREFAAFPRYADKVNDPELEYIY